MDVSVMPVRIETWSVEYRGTPYLAPEAFRRCLVGTAYGHPERAAGHEVMTSPIVSAKGRLVTTASGTIYELGEPSPAYLAWLKGKGIAFDPEAPIKVEGDQ